MREKIIQYTLGVIMLLVVVESFADHSPLWVSIFWLVVALSILFGREIIEKFKKKP
jgi:hypothetical protein